MIKYIKFISMFTFLIFSCKVESHDFWANGDPVPAWIKSSCCGVSDLHHLKPSQVHAVTGGYKVDGYDPNVVIPYNQTLPSQDGEYYIFYSHNSFNSWSKVFCFFVPPSSI